MRRLLFSLLAVGVGFLMVTVSALSLGRSKLVGQAGAKDEENGETVMEEKMSDEAREAGSGEEMMGEKAEVDYYLAYPGILPDHPFYFLKMLRDQVRLVLAGGPENKARLLLLYADKRIGAARALVEGGKDSLGLSTALKGEKYLVRAMDELEGISDEAMWQTAAKAALKHEQVLGDIEGQVESGGEELGEAKELNKSVIKRLMAVVELPTLGNTEEKKEGDNVMMPAADEVGKEGSEGAMMEEDNGENGVKAY